MASSRNPSSKGKVSAPKATTANQLGFRVNTLVLYKNNPYHIVAIGSRGLDVTIKKCTNANVIRDNIPLYHITLVDFKDPLYSKWGLIPQKADWARTREDELYTIKALVESTKGCGKEIRREVLVDVLRRNMWLGVWLRACYGETRRYRLKPHHLRKVRKEPRNPVPDSIFCVTTKLQFNKYKARKAAIEWVSMLETMHEDVWEVANMLLLHQFGDITYNDARYAMKETGCVPWLPKKEKGLL
jgi:hypothetical protein